MRKFYFSYKQKNKLIHFKTPKKLQDSIVNNLHSCNFFIFEFFFLITLFFKFIYMKTLNIFGNSIKFNFNLPIEETGYINENFDYIQKSAYSTQGIKSLLKYNNEIQISLIIGEVFKILKNQTNSQKLDYLQTIIINDIEVWCIDNGDTICLMTKEEY